MRIRSPVCKKYVAALKPEGKLPQVVATEGAPPFASLCDDPPQAASTSTARTGTRYRIAYLVPDSRGGLPWRS